MALDVEMPKIAKRSFYCALVLVAICNIGIFTIKTFTIIGSLGMRDPEPLQEWVVQHLPSHSKIVGDDRFYYACIKNDCDYQYLDRVKDHDTRARFHACTYKPDFLFISTQTSPAVIDAYTKEFHFLETINYLPSNENSFITNIIRRLPIAIQSSYEGALIRVKPRECFAIDEKDESKSLTE